MQIPEKSLNHLRSYGIVMFFLLIFLSGLGVLDRLNSTSAATTTRSTVITGTVNARGSKAIFDSVRNGVTISGPAGEKKPQSPTQAGQQSGQADQSQSVEQRSPQSEEAEHHDISPPLIAIPPAPRRMGHRVHDHERLPRPSNPNRNAADPVLQRQASAALAPVTTFNFDGIGQGFSGPAGTFTVNSAPPDTNGDIGPNHYVQIVNTDFAIFNKSGAVLYGPVPINTLWSGFGGGCQTNNDGDPVVVYDPIADRWVVSQFSVTTTPYLQCVAVSQTGDPTGAYNRYSFNYGNTDFPDYPKMGVWPDAYYITFNIFANGTTFSGSKVCAYDRTKMLAGQAATQQCFMTSNQFGGLLPADLDGARQPPAGSPNYVVGLGSAANQLAYWKFHVDWTTPANSIFTGPSTLATANFSEACAGGTCIPQSGTTQQLDSLADRLMFRLAYRNFGDHEALVVNHSVTASSSTGVRWYELRPSGGNLSIFQQGTYAPDSNYRWMGSIAMDQSGNMALGFSLSGGGLHPEIHYTGRLASSPAGMMDQGEASMIDGAGSQTGSNLSRWGDYSMIAVDPSDDCTFWYTNEYIPSNGAFNWKTRIASFKFPGCGTPTNDFSISASPTSVSVVQGGTGNSTISTAVTSGSAQTVTLSASGLPTGASASFNPASVTAGNSSTLTLTAGASTPAGTYTVTVTGTGTSVNHSTNVSFTVTAANDFSISASPTSLSLAQGTSGSNTISTAVTTGSAQTVSLSVSGVPSGATASLNPTSVTAGGSSTLTVNAGTAAAGTYTLTVTGAGTSATHSTTVSLTVIRNDFSISANPTSLSIAQGGSGTSTVSTAVTSGNAQAVSLSVSGVPSGASASFNPASVTAGGSSTLTINAGTAAASTYTLTVTGAGTYATHSTSVTVTVTSTGGGGGIVNGGFETGDFSGWTSAGTAAVVNSGAHSGTFAARVGGTSPTNGDSSIAQTFTAPAPGGALTFWYQVHCPDSLTYDWANASLKDNTTNTTTTMLANVCTNSGTWLQSSAATLVGGHSYTLTLLSHDDNYAGDPTFTLYDDVVIGAPPPPPPSGITNGGFETGDFSGWITAGTAAVINSGAHSGTYAARVGGTVPTNGDSSISQTFIVPAGKTTLSFWYANHCPDTVTYDWATATLKDNTTNTTTTVLTKVCTNSGTWLQKVANVVAGHSYTLTLTSHDDNYPSDPTYTLFDDVVIP